MDSPTMLQVCIAVAMLVVLVGALWPKLACRTSSHEDAINPSSAISDERAGHRYRHGLQVQERYQQMFDRWVQSGGPADETAPNDDRAA